MEKKEKKHWSEKTWDNIENTIVGIGLLCVFGILFTFDNFEVLKIELICLGAIILLFTVAHVLNPYVHYSYNPHEKHDLPSLSDTIGKAVEFGAFCSFMDHLTGRKK